VNIASFVAYHLLPLADAAALTFAAPLFLTALSWPILREPVGISTDGAAVAPANDLWERRVGRCRG
jgi:drug/metabolite transporter (DMT)-like permease